MAKGALLFTKQEIELMRSYRSAASRSFEISTDLGLTSVSAEFDVDRKRVLFGCGTTLLFEDFPKLKDRTIYRVTEDGQLRPLHFFSESTNRIYKLLPTPDYPSFSISSAPMHQITFSTPKHDTEAKLALLKPIAKESRALDTCFGMGYSAYELAKYCQLVDSFEVDSNVLELAALNPYSQRSLSSDRISITHDDIGRAIESIPSRSYDVILHDPPTFKIAPKLYSEAFYREMNRVLTPGGKCYHYCPRPNIRKKARDFTAEITRRIKRCGFSVVRYDEAAQGILIRPN